MQQMNNKKSWIKDFLKNLKNVIGSDPVNLNSEFSELSAQDIIDTLKNQKFCDKTQKVYNTHQQEVK